MQIPRSDPEAESPRNAGRRFRAALALVGAFVAVLWALAALDFVFGLELRRFGVRPHQPVGLLGLITMPLIHGGFVHLIHNTLPTLLLGTGVLYFYPKSGPRVLPWFWLAPGLFVWLAGATGSTHFGASGLNFALLAYLGLGGLLRRDVATMAVSMAVMFYYGGMLSGILPIEEGISWEGHLGGLLTGIVAALAYRRWDLTPRKRYEWEDEDEDEEPLESWPADPDSHEQTLPPSRTIH